MGGSAGNANATMPALKPMPGISQDPARVPLNAAQQIGTPGVPEYNNIIQQWSGYAPWLQAPQWGSSAYGYTPQPTQQPIPINQQPQMQSLAINQLPGQVKQGQAQTSWGTTPLFGEMPKEGTVPGTGMPGSNWGPDMRIVGQNQVGGMSPGSYWANNPVANWANNVNVTGMHQGIAMPAGILGSLGGVDPSMLGRYL